MPYFIRNDNRLFYREQGAAPLLLILPGNTAASACREAELAHFGQCPTSYARCIEWPNRFPTAGFS